MYESKNMNLLWKKCSFLLNTLQISTHPPTHEGLKVSTLNQYAVSRVGQNAKLRAITHFIGFSTTTTLYVDHMRVVLPMTWFKPTNYIFGKSLLV